jgi:DNA-directed RNA polymerase alpha subunit
MESIIQVIAELIGHLKLESLELETRCFYCGGRHKTTRCRSRKREEFLASLSATGRKECAKKYTINQTVLTTSQNEHALTHMGKTPFISCQQHIGSTDNTSQFSSVEQS